MSDQPDDNFKKEESASGDQRKERRDVREKKGSSSKSRSRSRSRSGRKSDRDSRDSRDNRDNRDNRDRDSRDNRERDSGRDRERERDRDSRGRRRSSSRDRYSRKESRRRSRSGSRSPSPSGSGSGGSGSGWNRPARKKGLWDQAPAGYEGLNVAQVASLNPQVLMPLLAPANSILLSKQSRRLYVGNMPAHVTDNELIEFFNAALVAAKIAPVGTAPVVGCQMNHEKNYAFVEFKTPEEATSGMAFDGITLHGQILKIRRPKDYIAPVGSPSGAAAPSVVSPAGVDSPGYPPNSPHATGFVSTNVQDTPHKIFVGGLPPHLTADQVKELISSFGQLKSFHLVMDAATPSLSKGYAFFEYIDESVTDRACEGLNGMKLADKVLLVQRAASNPNLPSSQFSSLPAANPLLTAILLGMPYIGATNPPPPTSNLLLLNMATLEEIGNDAEYQTLLEDVKEECSKFGAVTSIIIPKATGNNYALAKVYVVFESEDNAQQAHQTLGGRRYNGRTVVSHYVDRVPINV